MSFFWRLLTMLQIIENFVLNKQHPIFVTRRAYTMPTAPLQFFCTLVMCVLRIQLTSLTPVLFKTSNVARRFFTTKQLMLRAGVPWKEGNWTLVLSWGTKGQISDRQQSIWSFQTWLCLQWCIFAFMIVVCFCSCLLSVRLDKC